MRPPPPSQGHECLTRSMPPRPTGAEVARQRLLRLAGWAVVPVPQALWALHADEADQIMFLYDALQRAGVQL